MSQITTAAQKEGEEGKGEWEGRGMGRREGRKDGGRERRARGGGRELGRVTSVCCTDRVNQK